VISSWAPQTRAEARRAQGLEDGQEREGQQGGQGEQEAAESTWVMSPSEGGQADGLTGEEPEAHQHHAEQNRERVGSEPGRRC